MKKGIASIILFMIIAIIGCGCSNEEVNAEYQGKLNVQVKGIFQLSNDNLDTKVEELEDGQQFLFVIYDVENISEKNLENSFSETKIVTNTENEYDEAYTTNKVRKFLDNCGYETKIRGKELLGKSNMLRFISTYKVNKNDFNGECSGKFLIDFDDFDKPYEYNYAASDIQNINKLEQIFKVEDNEAEYLNARTLYVRSGMVKKQLENYELYASSNDLAAARLTLNLAEGIMNEQMGINLEEEAVNDSCFYSEQLACDTYPELAEKIVAISDNINKMFELHDKVASSGNMDDFIQLKTLLDQSIENCDYVQENL